MPDLGRCARQSGGPVRFRRVVFGFLLRELVCRGTWMFFVSKGVHHLSQVFPLASVLVNK